MEYNWQAAIQPEWHTTANRWNTTDKLRYSRSGIRLHQTTHNCLQRNRWQNEMPRHTNQAYTQLVEYIPIRRNWLPPCVSLVRRRTSFTDVDQSYRPKEGIRTTFDPQPPKSTTRNPYARVGGWDLNPCFWSEIQTNSDKLTPFSPRWETRRACQPDKADRPETQKQRQEDEADWWLAYQRLVTLEHDNGVISLNVFTPRKGTRDQNGGHHT